LSTFSYPAFKANLVPGLTTDFKCPNCGDALRAGSGSAEKTYSCANNHCFDMAKEGYLNLHLAQHKRSRNPGDSDEMVRSRQRFLNAGYYQDLAEALTAAIKQNGQNHRLLDIGCGEGYYLTEIQRAWPELQLVGLDISKTAVRLAAKRKLDAQLAVDSGFNMALFDNSVDTAISVFSPISASETSRVLKPEGQLIMVGPGEQHLSGLTAHIYDKSTAHGGNYQVLDNSPEFSLLEETVIEKDIQVEGSAISDLLHMTPYYWHAKPQQQKYLAELDQLETKIQFTLRVYSKRADKH